MMSHHPVIEPRLVEPDEGFLELQALLIAPRRFGDEDRLARPEHLLGVNLLGDWLRDVLDPRMKRLAE
jgi:hypothetical protein